MKKVVHIVEDLKIGGLERVIENIVVTLDPARFKVFILCLSKGGAIADSLINNNIEVIILNIQHYHNPITILGVAKLLRTNKIDIVHTHAYPAGVLGRIAAILAHVPCIFHHIHSTYVDLNKRNYFIERFLGRFTDKVICCSDAVKRFVLKKEGIPEDKLMVLYNGVPEPKPMNPSTIAGLKETLGIPREASMVGCVASLVQHKGHEYLFDAFKKVENAYLLLIGDGPLRTKLEQKASVLGISERVIFAGSQIDVTPYMQVMDIVVLPSSEREGLGIALIEAMALSKPVVATNIGGVPEVVDDGSTGILVQPQESDELAKAINTLLNSPDLTHIMGINGKKKYKKMFTLNYMIKRLETLYEGCS
jgi:glycosyltransferase involved in cell wall biosynthesis